MTTKASRKHWTVLWFLVTAGAGLLVRLVYLVQARANDPLFLAPQMDALYHHRWALALAARVEFIHDAFFRAPLYPYFLGLLYDIFGPNLFLVKLVQAVLGSASCGLVYLLARRLLADPVSLSGLRPKAAEWVARISGLAMAVYPLAIYFDGELLMPSLLVFLILLGFVLLLRSRNQNRQWWLPGLAFGLAAIARPNVLAFLGVLPLWFFIEYRKAAWKKVALFLGTAALVVVPVAVRNYIASGQLVLIAWQGGTNFYIGNNPKSDGVTAILPGTRPTWWGGYYDVKRLAEESAGRVLKGAEIDRYWMQQGLEFWRRQPARALGLVARKFYLLVSGKEASNNRDIYFFKRYSFLNLLIFDARVMKFPFGLLFPLAIVGFWVSRRNRRQLLPVYLFVAAYGLSFVAFFVTARFRMPMVPMFIVMAVYGTARLWRFRGLKLVGPVALLAGSLVLFNADLAGGHRGGNPVLSRVSVASALHEMGKPDEALAELRQALRYDSAMNVLTLEATIRKQQGQLDRAAQAAQAAIRAAPGWPDPRVTLGSVYAAKGVLDSAQACFAKAVELDPYSVQGWNNLGNIALTRNDLATARQFYERALSIDPVYEMALFHLGLADYYEGSKELARRRWRKVLELNPGHAKARQALARLR